jgi:hypothetical protein
MPQIVWFNKEHEVVDEDKAVMGEVRLPNGEFHLVIPQYLSEQYDKENEEDDGNDDDIDEDLEAG